MNTQLKIKRITRQRNLAALTALLLMSGIAATAASSAEAASITYVCVNKTTSMVYLKTKCSKTERRVAFKTVTNGKTARMAPPDPSAQQVRREQAARQAQPALPAQQDRQQTCRSSKDSRAA